MGEPGSNKNRIPTAERILKEVIDKTNKVNAFRADTQRVVELDRIKRSAAIPAQPTIEYRVPPIQLSGQRGQSKPKRFRERFYDLSTLVTPEEEKLDTAAAHRRRRLKETRPIHRLYNEILDANSL